MDETTPLDRLRARAEGRLGPAELAQLERELAADPALRALAEDYAFVHACTAQEPLAPVARLSLAELEAELMPRVPRRVAAAAALLLVAAGAFWAGRLSRAARVEPAPFHAEPLYLAAIELDEPAPAPAPALDVPVQWASYDPRGAEGVRFLADRAEAELLAGALGRPLLVYGTYPGCPLCKELDARVFSAPEVVALAERVVPLRLDLSQLPEAEQRALTVRGYPFLEVWRADGRPAHSLARRPDPGLFVESLHDGLEKSDATGEQPGWELLRSAAARYTLAHAAELEQRLADAERAYQGLCADPYTPAPIALQARLGRLRLDAMARQELLEARARAQVDVEGALAGLDDAARRFAGTPYAEDLAAVRARLATDRVFPLLAESDGS
ncbi:MAG TPA: thioredoxin family protein [Planctomycetota bacterium]